MYESVSPVEVFKDGDLKLEIFFDNNAESPREFECNLGIMVCFHRRYNLGDKVHDINASDFESWNEMEGYIWKQEKAWAVLPIYLFDHSGITISTAPFSCPWDSGQVGFIYTTREKIRELGIKLPRDKIKRTEKLEEMLRIEVETYDQFLTGEVYGFQLLKGEEETDSCWGFYGSDHKKSGLFETAGWPGEGVIA